MHVWLTTGVRFRIAHGVSHAARMLRLRGRRAWFIALVMAGVLTAVTTGLARSPLTSRRPTHEAAALRRPIARTIAGTGLAVLAKPLPAAAENRRYSLLIVGVAGAARAAHEPGRSLVYFSGTDVNTEWNSGVGAHKALANGWLLRDASGKLITNRAYDNNYIGDVGNPAYQQAWIQDVLRFLRSHHDDGVFIDDVLRDLGGDEAAKYPTQQAWEAAQLSFVKAVGTALRAKGYYVLVNASGYVPGNTQSDDGTSTIAWWQELGPYVSGLMNEYWQETSNGSDILRSSGSSWSQHWDGWQRLVQTAQSMHRDFVALTRGPAAGPQFLYGKASFLLDWNGGGGAYIYVPTDATSASGAVWATTVGTPVGAKQQVGAGWLRRYSRGIVLLDPSATQAQTFSLGAPYLAPDGTIVTSITLQPTTGLILSAAALGTAR